MLYRAIPTATIIFIGYCIFSYSISISKTNLNLTKEATTNLYNSQINSYLSTKYNNIEVKDNHVILYFYKSDEPFDKEKIEKYKIALKRNGDEKELINKYIREIQNDDNIVLSLKHAVLNIRIYDSSNKDNLLNNLYIRYSDIEEYWEKQKIRN